VFSASAQDVTVPVDYTFDSTTNFTQYHDTVIACFDYLMNTSCNVDLVKRKAVTDFLSKWIEATPTVEVSINKDVITYYDSSPELVIIFMAAWVVNYFKSANYSELEGSIAGTHAVLDYFIKNESHLKQDDHIDKLIDKRNKGKLEKFVRYSVKQ
jgi:hypothetical protein